MINDKVDIDMVYYTNYRGFSCRYTLDQTENLYIAQATRADAVFTATDGDYTVCEFEITKSIDNYWDN